MGLYVDDFVYFSPDDAVEKKFERLLAKHLKVDFMDTVEWFLGIHFQWQVTPDSVSVHLGQAGFAANLAEQFNQHLKSPSPLATPYRSGIPIDAIPESTEPDDNPTLLKRKHSYQSLVGSIGWLAQSTRPDLTPAHSFLSSSHNKPSRGHMQAALYVLHYIHSTHDYGITFTSENTLPLHTYIQFPSRSDAEAYSDAVPPSQRNSHRLTTYSDACWGSQIGNAVRAGTLLPLFKFRSMSGGIIFRSGGPIVWTAIRQEKTSLSSCESEIRATNEAGKLTVACRNLIEQLAAAGYPITDASSPSKLFNDNEACVKWCHNMTTKSTRYMEHRENTVREWVQDSSLSISHVKGVTNPADLFTKEMKDGTHFRRLRDSFMSRSSVFLHPSSVSGTSLAPVAQSSRLSSSTPDLLSFLLRLPSTHPTTSLCSSHLSSAGRMLLSAG
jgi:hypothetical protein